MCKGKLNDSLNCIGNTAYTVTLLFAIVIYNLSWDVAWLYCDLQLAELFVVIYSCVRSIWSQKLQRRMSNKRLVWKFYAFFVSLLSMWPWCSVFTCTRSHTQTCQHNSSMPSCDRIPTKSEPTSSKAQTHGIVFAVSQASNFLSLYFFQQISYNTNLRTGKCRKKNPVCISNRKPAAKAIFCIFLWSSVTTFHTEGLIKIKA